MSEKSDKGRWITSAADIKMDNIDNQLYINDSVEDFLDNKFFIIAEKGIGKTLLLKKKKYDLLQRKNGLFIPSTSDLDIPSDFLDLSDKTINFLEQEQYTKYFWTLSIQLSAIKKYYYDESIIPEPDKAKLPNTFIQILEYKTEYSTPSEIFHYFINDIVKVLQYSKDYFSIINSLYNQIHSPIYIFIDRLDQAMLINKTKVTESMWKAMQTGLLEAAWNLNEHNHHVKIFCSIRKEAFNEYTSPIKSNLYGQVCFLNYKEDELHKLVNTLSKYYENGKTIEDIVGFGDDGKFTHYKTGNEETIFRYMLRHTVAKPRDLIRIASTLKKNIAVEDDREKRIKDLRDATNEAAERIAKDIFSEKERFLDCLQDNDERKRFLSYIPKNTLNQSTVDTICKEFNGRDTNSCNKEQCLKEKSEGGCRHPFCELYNIGLFGFVRTDEPLQVFKDPDAEIVNHLIGRYSYYIVHPSLCEIIKKLRPNNGTKYMVTPGITTGNGYKWTQRESDISDLIDYVLNAGLPEDSEKKIMQSLKDTIKKSPNIKQLTSRTKTKIHVILKKKKVFLSYCGKDEETVNDIDKKFQEMGLDVTRDNRDLHYKSDIKNFMQSLKNHDYVITVISDSYLHSKSCMYEIGELLKINDYKTKTLQIILPDADIFDDVNKYKYLDFWTEKKSELEEKLKKNLSIANMQLIKEDIEHYNDIINNLPKFLNFVRGEKGMLLTDMKKSGYQTLLYHINRKRKK